VFCRVFGVDGHPGLAAVEQSLWRLAERELPVVGIEAWTQGLMDLGATVCIRRRPHCGRCPVADACVARLTQRTDALPASRPRRVVPQRAARLWILLRGGEVLVEKRPAAGIWGGLWSLPQSSPDAQPVLPGRRSRRGTLVRRGRSSRSTMRSRTSG
jgi:A/G-specific adenine glycosylase